MRTPKLFLPLIVLVLLSAGNARAMDRDFKSKVKPFFRLHCIRCHGPDREEGGMRVDEISGDLDDLNSIDNLQNILDEITVGSMPPASEPTPSDQALKNICLLYTSPSPRDRTRSRMPSSA